MQVIDWGPGGLVLAWPAQDAPPGAVTVLKDGVPVDAAPVRPADADAPLVNLADPLGFPRRVALAHVPGGAPAGARVGAGLDDLWTVPGEATPYCFRTAEGDGEAIGWELNGPLGLDDWRPAPGRVYLFSLDIGQHRCAAGLAIEWLDEDGLAVGREEAWRRTGPFGGRDASGYAALSVSAACPGSAARGRLLLLHGPATEPPDAYLFFRNPRLGESDAAGRPTATVGVAALGDALRLYGSPLRITDGRTEAAVPARNPLPPLLPVGLSLVIDGRHLVVDAAAPPDADLPARPAAALIDGALAGTETLARGKGGYGAMIELDDRFFDGDWHQVELRDEATGETLAQEAMPLLPFRTALDVMRDVAPGGEDPGVQPFARERYRALLAALERLREARAPADLYAEAAAAHAALMRGPKPLARYGRRRMPRHDRPRFSIVIPVHDKLHFTHHCLCAVLLTTAGLPVEVIVVDDGSTDRTTELERIWDGVAVVRHARAGGFVRACAAGVAASRGEFVVLLNNDTEPMGRWLEELHLPFEAFADVGLTGAKLVYPDGRLQEAGGIVWNNGKPWNLGWGGNPQDPRWSYTRPADYLSGAAIMFPRAVWDRVGGFSREFEPAYYEDTDFAFKVREEGLRTVYAAPATVVHHEGVSSGTDLGQGMKRFQSVNRPKFEAKWRHRFRGRGAEGVDPDREKDRDAVGRALVLDDHSPRFDMDAGSHAISQEIRLLQSFGYKVSLAPKNMAYLGRYSDAFARGGVEHLHAPFYASLPDVIARRGAEFDLVYIHRFATATGLPKLIRRHAPKARILLNCADLHFLRELRAARVAASEQAFQRALKLRNDEVAAFRDVDAVLTYSEAEKAVIESLLGMRAEVHLLPFTAGDAGEPAPLADRADIGFIGSWDHLPNRDAVEWFARECWPAIRARRPHARFRLAGSGFDASGLADAEGVEVVGWVPDARAFIGSCRAMVAPLRVGAGIKGKVVDALAAGTPNVLSAIAAEGLGLEQGGSALVARGPDEWADAVDRLLSDDALWTRVSEAGLALVRARHSFDAARPRFREVLEAAGLPYDPAPEPGRGALAPVMSYDTLSRLHLRARG